MTKELITKMEKALGFKLYPATIRYLDGEETYPWSGRGCGKTIAHILKLVLQKDKVITDIELGRGKYIDEAHGVIYPRWYRLQFLKIRRKLAEAGIEVIKIKGLRI